jgi:hypothetical protein
MMNKDDALKAFVTDSMVQKRLAKHLVLQCFRNSVLEDLHSGIAAASKTGDYTDVVVHTSYGEIPWKDLSRIDDAEMKVLMVDVVNRAYQFIQELFDEERGGQLILKLTEKDSAPNWDDPK